MGNLWLKIKVWTKTTIAVLMLIYGLIFVYKNMGSDKTVEFWFWFNSTYRGQLLMLMLVTFLAGGLTYFIVRTLLTTIKQLRELRKRKFERDAAEMMKKAAMLKHTSPAGTNDVSPPATP